MPKPKTARDLNLNPCWKVRIVLQGALLHVLSASRPVVQVSGGQVIGCEMEVIAGTNHGDEVGFIHWPSVNAITFREAPLEVE